MWRNVKRGNVFLTLFLVEDIYRYSGVLRALLNQTCPYKGGWSAQCPFKSSRGREPPFHVTDTSTLGLKSGTFMLDRRTDSFSCWWFNSLQHRTSRPRSSSFFMLVQFAAQTPPSSTFVSGWYLKMSKSTYFLPFYCAENSSSCPIFDKICRPFKWQNCRSTPGYFTKFKNSRLGAALLN